MGDLDAVTEAVFRGAAEQKACRDVPTARLRAGLLKDALEALAEIAKGKGAYSMDPLEHCANTVEEAKAKARAVLAEADGQPEQRHG